jgi:hypothetical protein
MIRARAGKLVLLGITRANLERLMKGQPMRIPGDDPAIGLPGVTIAIMYGETEEAIAAELRAHGLIHETTVVEDRRDS